MQVSCFFSDWLIAGCMQPRPLVNVHTSVSQLHIQISVDFIWTVCGVNFSMVEDKRLYLLGSFRSVTPVCWYTTEVLVLCSLSHDGAIGCVNSTSASASVCSSKTRGVFRFWGVYTRLLHFSQTRFNSTQGSPFASSKHWSFWLIKFLQSRFFIDGFFVRFRRTVLAYFPWCD